MILGVTRDSWISTLSEEIRNEYLKLVDNLVVVSTTEKETNPPFYYVKGDYATVISLLKELSVCKAYPQKTLYAVNFSIVEIVPGMTPSKLKEEWLNELRTRHLV